MPVSIFSWEEPCMGTYFLFKIRSDFSSANLAGLITQACEILHEADQTFSLYKNDSELSRIARQELTVEKASDSVRAIYRDCEVWREKTNGWFDATNQEKIFDPSGIVKTWAAKRAALFLEANGVKNFTLNAGGDIYLSSELSVNNLWRVGLADLNKREEKGSGSNMTLNLKGSPFRAVATSGSVERGEHIWAKGVLPEKHDVVQVTVVGQDLVVADIWATAIYAGGREALAEMNKVENSTEITAAAIVTYADGSMTASKGFTALLASN